MGTKSAPQTVWLLTVQKGQEKWKLCARSWILFVHTNLGIIAISPVERRLCKLKIICFRQLKMDVKADLYVQEVARYTLKRDIWSSFLVTTTCWSDCRFVGSYWSTAKAQRWSPAKALKLNSPAGGADGLFSLSIGRGVRISHRRLHGP